MENSTIKVTAVITNNDKDLELYKKHDADAGFDLKARAIEIHHFRAEEKQDMMIHFSFETKQVLINGNDFDKFDNFSLGGYELYNRKNNTFMLLPEHSCLVKTGIICPPPVGMEAQVRPRSGLALKHCISITNSPGTVDAKIK